MSLKRSEIENCSRINTTILISSFESSFCSQITFPSIIRPILYLWMMIYFKDEILSCRIQLLHRLPFVTFDCVEEDWWLSSRDRTNQDLVLMVQCHSIFFGVLVWLLSSQRVLSVEVLPLPLTWLQPHSCLFLEFALVVDLQEFLYCLE